MSFKRTAPAFRRCTNRQERPSFLELGRRRYLGDHGLRKTLGDVLVTHTFDLLEMTARGDSENVGAMVSRSQREATTVLRSLFGFQRYEPPPEEDAANAAAYADSYARRADAPSINRGAAAAAARLCL